ncbi:SusD/RagB family nutrient-binding outer membrane lipoprotein [Hymenobacter psychrotolerans]|uniref:Starch-binding associating with outer membrane n=1 Tax=Hymenobacter psychrotolerans DSM 18569 TaxID=1121959 RepID=A0A1M7EQL1_9BACT|nr:SusD/RagB family nutrient-binding outer membrane lipoprotein [Hymenobacter psychrotolerans]SHL93948.1 Starch-binding associating with outer membrane [Hymenobacter psychrotolerans DSM 18569]
MKTFRYSRRRMLPLLASLGLLLAAPACTDRFEEINTDPTKAVDVPANLLFSRALKYGTLYDNDYQLGEHLHANMWVQFFANSNAAFPTDRYETGRLDWVQSFWNTFYSGYGMDLQQAIRYVENSPEEVNKLSEARIWRVFLFQRMTDYWGDMPYFDAFKGLSDGNVRPNYDPQQAIYEDFVKELKEASAAIDDTKRGNYGQADLLFGNAGSHAASTSLPAVNNRWRRFANSLRLRVAMRMSKANPALAEQQVRDALASGVMNSNAESAIMKNTGGSIRINQNPLSVVLTFVSDQRVSATLVDYLTRYNDPRLNIFADPVSSSNPARVGLPNGLSATQLAQPQYAPANFSQGGARYKNSANDQNLLTYSEVCFLRAEAALRGWDNTGTAQSWYETGVREAMALAGVTDGAAITAYLNGPLVRFNPAQAQQQISTQKWLSLFGHNGFEAYAEYRRTGFPVLQQIPNTSSETNGQVPRRMRYAPDEARQNPDGYQQALGRQGPDLMTTRIWWDKQ